VYKCVVNQLPAQLNGTSPTDVDQGIEAFLLLLIEAFLLL